MRPRGIALMLTAGYCLLSTVCLVCLIVFWSGFLKEQSVNCREKARQTTPPLIAESIHVYEEDDGDTDPGSRIAGYITASAFDEVVAFYEQAGALCVTSENTARCTLPGTDEAQYMVEIKIGDTQTLYQVITTWNCQSTN